MLLYFRYLIGASLLWLLTGCPATAGLAMPSDTSYAGKNERPNKPKFILEADQRFFFFKEAAQPLLSRQTNVWGARAGLLLPSNIKAGIGYYFGSQRIDKPTAGYQAIHQRMRYLTAYAEPFFFRRKYWELSAPVEVGVGKVRYTFDETDTQPPGLFQTTMVPLTVGVSVSTKFPVLWGFKPLRWLGVNFMGGYRYTLERHPPTGHISLNGVYYSISPAVFLDRIYQDLSAWRRKHRRSS